MSRCTPLTREELKNYRLPPVKEADKDAHGRLLLIAGSSETPGSAAIAATAAMRSGCGKVTIATVEPVAPHVALAVPEALVVALPAGREQHHESQQHGQVAVDPRHRPCPPSMV